MGHNKNTLFRVGPAETIRIPKPPRSELKSLPLYKALDKLFAKNLLKPFTRIVYEFTPERVQKVRARLHDKQYDVARNYLIAAISMRKRYARKDYQIRLLFAGHEHPTLYIIHSIPIVESRPVAI